jgi:hypothetical protein
MLRLEAVAALLLLPLALPHISHFSITAGHLGLLRMGKEARSSNTETSLVDLGGVPLDDILGYIGSKSSEGPVDGCEACGASTKSEEGHDGILSYVYGSMIADDETDDLKHGSSLTPDLTQPYTPLQGVQAVAIASQPNDTTPAPVKSSSSPPSPTSPSTAIIASPYNISQPHSTSTPAPPLLVPFLISSTNSLLFTAYFNPTLTTQGWSLYLNEAFILLDTFLIIMIEIVSEVIAWYSGWRLELVRVGDPDW